MNTFQRGGSWWRALVVGISVLGAAVSSFAQVGTSFLLLPESGHGYVEVPHAPALNPTSAMTVEAWIYLAQAGGCTSLVGKDFTQAYWFGVCGRDLRFYGRGGVSANSTAQVPLSRWTHVAVTFDGTVKKFYIDGELGGEVTTPPGPLGASTAPLRIGSDVAWEFSPNGALHEVRLWNITRTQAEIQSDRLMRLTSARPGLVAVWPLDTDGRDARGVYPGRVVGMASFGPLGMLCSNSYWVPTAARLAGVGGSQWATDVVVFNPAATPATLQMYMLPRDGDNAGVAPLSRTVPAGQASTFADVVLSTFGQASLAGSIQVCSDTELTVSWRTYTREGAKTYGFGSQATRRQEAIESGQTRRITDIRENAGFRTNLGLTNVGTSSVTVRVRLILADGTLAGERSYTLQPFSHIQRNRVVREFTAADVSGAEVTVEPAGGRVIAYAAAVDNSTNDSTYVEARY